MQFICIRSWWRHQMETFSMLLAICAGNSPVAGELHAQRPLTRSFHVFLDLCLNIPLSKQSWGWWFETLSRPLRRHCNIEDDASLTILRNVSDLNYFFVHQFVRAWAVEFNSVLNSGIYESIIHSTFALPSESIRNFLRNVKLAGYSILDIGHSNV